MRIKTTRYYYAPITIAKSKVLTLTAAECEEQWKLPYTVGVNALTLLPL